MKYEEDKGLWFEHLQPEELEPRLELQIFVDPMAVLGLQAESNVINCGKGDNCCQSGATCSFEPN